jgi:succinate dehydrogenase/fumarate reductase flavoprotein subunit
MDTIEGGKWLPDQDLAWRLVTGAVERIHELENELGCFFDRNPTARFIRRRSPVRPSIERCTRAI